MWPWIPPGSVVRFPAGSRQQLPNSPPGYALMLAASSIRQAPDPTGGSALWLTDVDHPGCAVAVDTHAELVAPRLLLQGHRHRSALGQLLPVTTQVLVVPTEADADGAVGRAVVHSRWRVRRHQGETRRGL